MREAVAGLAWRPPRDYLRPMASHALGPLWGYFGRFNPIKAGRDLRLFLTTRKTYELWFMFASLVCCVLIVAAFIADSNIPKPYQPPEIIYVKNWRADRTIAEIKAQAKIDEAKKAADAAELKKLQDAKRAEFKRAHDQWGWLL